MIKAIAAVVGLSSIAGAAHAQTTNTNCQTIGNQVYCNSTTRPDPWATPPATAYQDAYKRGQENSQRMWDAFQQGQQLRQQREERAKTERQAIYERETREAAGRMIAAGRCEDALELALTRGMLSVAQEVQGVCRAGE